MDANLVGAARAQIGFDEGERAEAQAHAPIRAGGAAFAAASRHARAAAQIARNRKIDGACLAFDLPVQQRDVGFLHKPLLEILHELAMSFVRARHDNCPRGVFVEPMHDARPQRASDARKSPAAKSVQKRGDKRARIRARTGVHDHSGGLVDYGHVRVFVEHVERNGFRFDARGRRRRNLDRDIFSGRDAMRGAARSAVHLHAAFVHQRLNARAAQFGKLRHEKAVQPLTGVFRGNNEFAVSGGIHLR